MSELELAMNEVGIKRADIQYELGMSRYVVYTRIKGISQWQLHEIIAVVNYINKEGSKRIKGFKNRTIDELFRGR